MVSWRCFFFFFKKYLQILQPLNYCHRILTFSFFYIFICIFIAINDLLLKILLYFYFGLSCFLANVSDIFGDIHIKLKKKNSRESFKLDFKKTTKQSLVSNASYSYYQIHKIFQVRPCFSGDYKKGLHFKYWFFRSPSPLNYYL